MHQETQIARHTHSAETQVSVFSCDSETSQCVSSYLFTMSSDSSSDDGTIILHYYHRYRKRKARKFWLHPYTEKNFNLILNILVNFKRNKSIKHVLDYIEVMAGEGLKFGVISKEIFPSIFRKNFAVLR